MPPFLLNDDSNLKRIIFQGRFRPVDRSVIWFLQSLLSP